MIFRLAWVPRQSTAVAVFVFDGVPYRWSGWFGCQLETMEWRAVPAGTWRTLTFSSGERINVSVYSARREGLRVRLKWAVSDSGTFEEHSSRIRDLRRALAGMLS